VKRNVSTRQALRKPSGEESRPVLVINVGEEVEKRTAVHSKYGAADEEILVFAHSRAWQTSELSRKLLDVVLSGLICR
jgi:hypothetical protein